MISLPRQAPSVSSYTAYVVSISLWWSCSPMKWMRSPVTMNSISPRIRHLHSPRRMSVESDSIGLLQHTWRCPALQSYLRYKIFKPRPIELQSEASYNLCETAAQILLSQCMAEYHFVPIVQKCRYILTFNRNVNHSYLSRSVDRCSMVYNDKCIRQWSLYTCRSWSKDYSDNSWFLSNTPRILNGKWSTDSVVDNLLHSLLVR